MLAINEIEKLSNKGDDYLEKAKAFFTEYPEYIYLITGVIFLILFIGTLKNKNWAIDPNSGYQRFFYNTFGRKAFRIVTGSVFLLAAITGIGFFFFKKINE